MAEKVRLVITGTPQTGKVAVEGPIDNMLLAYWLLGEAKRIIERRADERDSKQQKGRIVVPDIRVKVGKDGH
jgi:hypothetical protein